jgi:hypothetical protein
MLQKKVTKQELAKIKRAARLIEEAAIALRSVEHATAIRRNWPVSSSAAFTAAQIEQVLSCDNGEAGLKALIAALEMEGTEK